LIEADGALDRALIAVEMTILSAETHAGGIIQEWNVGHGTGEGQSDGIAAVKSIVEFVADGYRTGRHTQAATYACCLVPSLRWLQIVPLLKAMSGNSVGAQRRRCFG
jgi:hypothetical protein